MEQTNITAKLHMTQPIGEETYTGNIWFDEVGFRYKLDFVVPLENLEDPDQANLTIIDDRDKVVPLDYFTKKLFRRPLLLTAIDLYQHPKNNVAIIIRDQEDSDPSEPSANIEIDRRYSLERTSRLEKFLGDYREGQH